jgi:putative hydrolase of the HAD superfamily
MLLKDYSKVKVLLFDLGGVVINRDWDRSVKAFSSITNLPTREIIEILKAEDFVFRIETGNLEPNAFREWFSLKFNIDCPDSEIDSAWNAMLLDIPSVRISWMERLKPHYQLMCLSNTNQIHINKLNQILSHSSDYSDLNQILHRCFYSHELKMRKPDTNIFERVLSDIKVKPVEILYFEDNQNNFEKALKMGMKAVLVSTENTIEKFFNEQIQS